MNIARSNVKIQFVLLDPTWPIYACHDKGGNAMLAILVIVLAETSGYGALPVPLPATGECASGYAESSASHTPTYCAPKLGKAQRLQRVVPATGLCPEGFRQSGNYCVKLR